MSERVKWINYKEKEIIFVDYNSLAGDEVIKVIDEAEKAILLSAKHDILHLVCIRDSKGSPAVMSRYKEFSTKIKPFVKKDAVFGASGLHSILLNTIRTFAGITLKPFNTEEEAKDYLVSD